MYYPLFIREQQINIFVSFFNSVTRVDEKTGQEVQITGTPPPIRPIGVTEIPSPAKLASVTHVPDYEYGHVKRATKKVDSNLKASHKQTSYSVGGPPEHIGSTFRHLPNSANMRTGSVPSDHIHSRSLCSCTEGGFSWRSLAVK